jgi:glutaredoxin
LARAEPLLQIHFGAIFFPLQINRMSAALVVFKMRGCPYCTPLTTLNTSPLRKSSALLPVYFLDSNEDQEITRLNNVRQFPTIRLYKGPAAFEYTGARDEGSIYTWVKTVLAI